MTNREHGLNKVVNLVVMSSVGTNGEGAVKGTGTAAMGAGPMGGSRTVERGAGTEQGGSGALSFRKELEASP